MKEQRHGAGWPGTRSAATAILVALGLWAIGFVNIDAAAAAEPSGSGVIVGQVVDSTGVAVADARVSAYASSGVTAATTDPFGSFVLADLAAGDVHLFVDPVEPGLLDEWFGGSATLANSTPVVIDGPGAFVAVGKVVARPASSVSGQVTDDLGEPLLFTKVTATPSGPGASQSVHTATNGSYTLTGLRPGSYVVSFESGILRPPWSGPAGVFYDGDDALARQDLAVEVGVGDAVTGFDVALDTSYVAGIVTGLDGAALVGVEVSVTDANGHVVGSRPTNGEGRFLIGTLGVASGQLNVSVMGDVDGFDVPAGVSFAAGDRVEVVMSARAVDEPPSIDDGDPVEDAPSVLLVAGSTRPPAGDVPMIELMTNLGMELVVVEDDAIGAASPDDFAEFDLIVLSSSVVPPKVGDALAKVAVPVLTWEAYLLDEMGLARANGESRTRFNSINIVDADHPIMAGLAAGPTTVLSSLDKLSYGTPGPGATVLATVPGQPNQAAVFVYEPGAEMSSGLLAPACRTSVFANYSSPTTLTSAGATMLTNALDFTLGCEPAVVVPDPTGPDPTDPDPTDPDPRPAGTEVLFVAGNVRPPAGDLPILAILDELGLTVTTADDDRLGPADVDPEAFDLVIIASSVVPSKVGGRFATTAVPVLTWEAYLLDDSNLASAVRETTGSYRSIRIATSDHPITAGVNTQSATVLSAPGTLSYGTPGPDATVLATVPGRPNQAVLFTYEPLDRLTDGTLTPSCRTSVFTSYDSAPNLTSVGKQLMTQAISFTLDCAA
jgi:hypothetical protein